MQTYVRMQGNAVSRGMKDFLEDTLRLLCQFDDKRIHYPRFSCRQSEIGNDDLTE